MKRLLLFFSLLFGIALSACSQTIKPDVILSPNGPNTSVYWNVKFKTMVMPHYLLSNRPVSQDTIGQVFLNTDPSDAHIYIKTGAGYIPLANMSDLASASASWVSITGKPTTIAGYGITDAASLSQQNTNTSNIATNTSNIATNTTNISNLQTSKQNAFSVLNGLTLSGGNLTLGGDLNTPTTVTTNDVNSFTVKDAVSTSRFLLSQYNLIMNSFTDVATGNYATLQIDPYNTRISNSQQNILISNTAPITITDSHFNKGMLYQSDYSANFTSRSLIDKGYADANYATISGASYAANNGIVQTGNTFGLGGNMTSNTTVTLGIYPFQFFGAGPGHDVDLALNPAGSADIWGHNGEKAYLHLSAVNGNSSISEFGLQNALTQYSRLTFTPLGMLVFDDINTTGLRNNGSYATNGKRYNTWLAEWGAVKSRIDSAITANATYTASNGIVKSGSNFTLGGSLGQTTITDLNNFAITYQNLSANSNGYQAGLTVSPVVNNEFAQLTLTKSFGGIGAYVKAYPTFAGLSWYSNSTTQASFNIGAGGATYTDQINLKPIEYAADYSSNYDSRSIIDKGYADAHYSTVGGSTAWGTITGKPTTLSGYGITDAGSLSQQNTNTSNIASLTTGKQDALTVNSGLTLSGTTLTLGGTLAANTNIDLANTYTFNVGNSTNEFIKIGNGLEYIQEGASGSNHSIHQMSPTALIYGTYVGGMTTNYTVSSNTSSLTLGYNTTGGSSILQITSTGTVFNDNYLLTGIKYYADYSANFTSRSLIDKGYADANYAPIGYSAPVSWSSITSKPTTLSGFGITDAGTLSQQNTNTSNISTNTTNIASNYTAIGIKQPRSLFNYVLGTNTAITSADSVVSAFGKVQAQINAANTSISGKQASISGTGYSKWSGSSVSFNATIPNADLTNSSLTLQGSSVSLGGSLNILSGTGFVKVSGTTISYDNSTYLTTGTAASTYAPLASAALTGSPTAPTPSTADNSTNIATTAYVQNNFTANTVYYATGLYVGSTGTGTAGSVTNPFTFGTGVIGIGNLSATGTPSSSTYLRGDNTWATITSGGTVTSITAGTGLTGGTITSSGTVAVDLTAAFSWTGQHIFSVTNTASSGSNYGFKITNTVNQTSTAAFTDLLINRTNTAPGSGTQRLLDLQVNGSSVLNVNTFGGLTLSSSITSNGSFTANQFSTSGTFSGDGLYIYNSATAASGTPSLNSLRTRYMASVWNTTATAAPNYANIINELRTTSGTTPTYKLAWAGNLSTTTTPGTFTDLAYIYSTGDFQAVKSIRGTAVTFANVPPSPIEGMLIPVTDSSTSTYGATITGGGSNHVLAYYNGTNWTVH